MSKKNEKVCYFSTTSTPIDYKDAVTLKMFISPQGKIVSRHKTGTTTRNQRKLAQAIKRARFLAIVPYVTK